jgi:hypothetical protein
MILALLVSAGTAATATAGGFTALEYLAQRRDQRKMEAAAKRQADTLRNAIKGVELLAEAGEAAQQDYYQKAKDSFTESSVAFEPVEDLGGMLLTGAEQALVIELMEAEDVTQLTRLLFRLYMDQPRRARLVNMGVAA